MPVVGSITVAFSVSVQCMGFNVPQYHIDINLKQIICPEHGGIKFSRNVGTFKHYIYCVDT